MQAIAAQSNQAASANDMLRLQVIWNRLIAVVEEQAQVLLRTSFSPIVRECGDLSAGLFDLRGRMLTQAITGTPGHVNSMAVSVGHFLSAFPLASMGEGDAFICNDPWLGTGHSNDFVVVTPAFHRGVLVALLACTSHVVDIGGSNGPDGPDVFMEGLAIPMLRLAHGGQIDETLISMIRANSRLPVDAVGDTYALLAANDVGVRRLVETLDEFNMRDCDDISRHIISRSRAAMLERVGMLPFGSWEYAMTVDGYDQPVDLRACLTISEGRIHVDYSGSSAPVRRGINVPIAYTTAYTVFGLGCVIARDIPNNAGSLSPLTVSAPSDTILNAQRPCAVKSRHVLGQMLPDMVFGCLRQILPERVPAEGTSCMWNIAISGSWATGDDIRPYGLAMATNGGTGARFESDGLSATAYPSGVRGTPIEIAESQTPLLFWRKDLRPDSGGPGKTRGGLGQIIEVENGEQTAFTLMAAFDRIMYPPRGRDGGGSGQGGFVGLTSGERLSSKGSQLIEPGQRVMLLTPGGGGIGDPRSRPRDQVVRDLASGLISEEAAREIYGLDEVAEA